VTAPVPLRRNRDFILLWSGELASGVGSGTTAVAFPLLVLALTGSPVKAGIVAFAGTLPPVLAYLPLGVLVDRSDRRRVMVVTGAIGAVALGSIPLALAFDALTFGQIVTVAVIEGLAVAAHRLAENGAVPLVVAPEQLREAVARNELRRTGAGLAGPPLGGALFGVARLAPFLFDAVSYVASAVSVLFVRGPLQQPRVERAKDWRAELREGLAFMWRSDFLRVSGMILTAANLIFGGIDVVLIVRAQEGGATAAAVGAMFLLWGLGGFVGALAAPRAIARLPTPLIIMGAFWLEAAAMILLTSTHDPYALGTIAMLSSLTAPAWNAVVLAAKLEMTPDHLQGRVGSVMRMFSGAAVPLGALAGGALVSGVGTTTTLLIFGGWQAAVSVVATTSRAMRSIT
jgi:predicted MFS family arabinose efflux permease